MTNKGLNVIIKVITGIVALAFIFLVCLNPDRGSFNHAVFEGGIPNSITSNQKIMQNIIETNRQCYQNEKDTRVKRKNNVLFSIYDVQVSNTQTYHILGIGGIFRLLNS